MITTTVLLSLVASTRYLLNYIVVALAYALYHSLVCMGATSHSASPGLLLFNSYVAYDSLTLTIVMVSSVALIWLLLLYGETLSGLAQRMNTELMTLMVLLLVALVALASANSYLSLFVAIELQSLVLYILLATNVVSTPRLGSVLHNTPKVSLSYLINAAMATAFLLLGMAYSSTVLVLVATLWKLGVVPLHVWSLPILDSQHSLITATYLTIAKYGTLVVIGLVASSSTTSTSLLIYVGLANLVIGNVLGLLQYRYQRVIVYSSLIQIGYMLLVLGTSTSVAITYFELYSFYTVLLLVLWALPSVTLPNAGALLPSVQLWLMVLTLYTVAGLPFMPLFWTKLDVLLAVSSQAVAVALLSTLLSSLIYIRLIKYISFGTRYQTI